MVKLDKEKESSDLDKKISDIIQVDVWDVDIEEGGPVVLLVGEWAHSTLRY